MRGRAAGFTLTEVLISVALGLTLIAAGLGVVQRCRGLFAGGESLAQVQDAARHALHVIVGDIEHAGFYGAASADAVELVRNGVVIATRDELRQPTPLRAPAPVAGLPAGAHDCGINFAVDLARPVEAAARVAWGDGDCEPTASAGGARAGADTLTLRQASLALAAPRAGRVQVYSRAASGLPLQLFADGDAPGPNGAASDEPGGVRDLEVRGYYVANRSVRNAMLPALRVKALTEAGGTAQFRDEEVMPGIEDLQVELGIHVPAADGAVTLTFVPAGSPAAADAHVVAVRLWLRVRAETADPGFRDDRTFRYADVTFTPAGDDRRYRRLLVTRTIALRNAT